MKQTKRLHQQDIKLSHHVRIECNAIWNGLRYVGDTVLVSVINRENPADVSMEIKFCIPAA